MKAVILAGGLGTRLSEETDYRPKPMVEIGGRPILWHIMKLYAAHGISEFVVCLGHKGYMIREYFANYLLHNSDLTVRLGSGAIEFHARASEDWTVTLVDTGEATQTGGRLRRVRSYLADDTFCMTYGDGLADVDLGALIAFHAANGCAATVTAVRPPGRFGALRIGDGATVEAFQEKPVGDGAWINGGFFVLETSVLDLIANDDTIWEREPMERLVAQGRMAAYRHTGFWQPMDTLRDKRQLEALWESGHAPWKIWPAA